MRLEDMPWHERCVGRSVSFTICQTKRPIPYGIRHKRGKDEDIEENHAETAEIHAPRAHGTPLLCLPGLQTSVSPCRPDDEALAGVSRALTPTTSLVPGGAIMPEFVVAVDHITYYAVQAEDELTAIDLVLEGEGLEIDSETRDASISVYESREPRRHA
jgi:hypothetical protein